MNNEMMAKLTPRTLISIITELEERMDNLRSREKVDGIYISELKSEIKDQKDQMAKMHRGVDPRCYRRSESRRRTAEQALEEALIRLRGKDEIINAMDISNRSLNDEIKSLKQTLREHHPA
jgi:uncharacterized coiled-coil protein SlyX